ncbi:MAG: hypothetical protein HRU80_02940 [Ignavibacteriales bacterium]|nr:MAG: hypothetical protein HRU80_02940 [Ignavibacteriales bacterium]
MVAVKSSLKTKIIMTTGVMIVALMLLISVVMLVQWRKNIIHKHAENVYAVTRTFSVTIVDALIFEEKSVFQKENILQTYIDNFINYLGNVKYVTVYDKNATPIAWRINNGGRLKTPSGYAGIQADISSQSENNILISQSAEHGWVITCTAPMNMAGNNWGYLQVGFDAEPIRQEIASLFLMLVSATVIITSGVLLLLYLLINRLTGSLGRLVHEIDKIDLVPQQDISLPEKDDEIGFLYHHFGLLQKRLDTSRRELESAQKQIYQAEKLASIGRLASGVAHQVNNPLNGIKSCLYAIKKDPANIYQTKEYLDLISEGIDNIETVVKKLLGFARQQSKSQTSIDVNESIQKVVQLTEYRLRENQIRVTTGLQSDLPRVMIDYHLFQEVIMNLLLNSFDALQRNGEISIYTRTGTRGDVIIEISDTGSGMDAETMKKIFDPFFTTKDIGIGTGLGLSVCLGIIESHNGKIEVKSTPGEGTRFTISLPIAKEHETVNN